LLFQGNGDILIFRVEISFSAAQYILFVEEVSYLPNIKSASKRDQLAKARNAVNKANKTALKTTIKKFDLAAAEGDKAAAAEAYTAAIKAVDHAATKGLVHKNNAARKKSRLTKSLNALA
jgi:small subunit ribosomal protein S20